MQPSKLHWDPSGSVVSQNPRQSNPFPLDSSECQQHPSMTMTMTAGSIDDMPQCCMPLPWTYGAQPLKGTRTCVPGGSAFPAPCSLRFTAAPSSPLLLPRSASAPLGTCMRATRKAQMHRGVALRICTVRSCRYRATKYTYMQKVLTVESMRSCGSFVMMRHRHDVSLA